jgi:hypothetical protein
MVSDQEYPKGTCPSNMFLELTLIVEDFIRKGGQILAWSCNKGKLERVYYEKKQYEKILFYFILT